MTENPNYPMKDWQNAVSSGSTKLGYLDWIATKAGMNIPENDEPELKTYRITLAASFRGYCDHEIEAATDADALAKIKALDFNNCDFDFEYSNDIEGDEVIIVDADEFSEDTPEIYSRSPDGTLMVNVQLDARKPDQPYSWDACNFVLEMARLTTPYEDWQAAIASGSIAADEYADESEWIADLDDEKLCSEYAAFMTMVRKARAMLAIEPF